MQLPLVAYCTLTYLAVGIVEISELSQEWRYTVAATDGQVNHQMCSKKSGHNGVKNNVEGKNAC